MNEPLKILAALIIELVRQQASDHPFDGDGGGTFAPGQIAVGQDRFLMTSREMERLIDRTAKALKARDPSLARATSDKEWTWSVRTALGPILGRIDLDDPAEENAQAVFEALSDELASIVRGHGRCEHAFGCTLVGGAVVEPFAIGPVSFEPRLTWLERKMSEGELDAVTGRRIARAWSGARLRKREAGRAYVERVIREGIGTCPYVCSVVTEGLAPEAGRLKAQTSARLALAAIALSWAAPARALDGLRLLIDGGVLHQWTLVFHPGRIISSGGNLKGLPHGPSISGEAWLTELTRRRADLNAAGEAIAYFLSATGNVPRPKTMNVLSQALLWFHEGCREQVDLMAVVKFWACMDALGGGKDLRGVTEMLTARLGAREDKPIFKNEPRPMKSILAELYGEGRSRPVHGTSERLGHDSTTMRERAEQLARLGLLLCLDWVSRHPGSDDPARLRVPETRS